MGDQEANFCTPILRSWVQLAQWFQTEEKVFENVDGWPTEDDRKPEAGVIGILLAQL